MQSKSIDKNKDKQIENKSEFVIQMKYFY